MSVVGYQGNGTATAHPGVGSTFVPVSGGETYKLGEIQVESVEADTPFDPDTEYVQVLDDADTHVTGRYTYLSAQYCDWYADEVDEDLADILRENIGWWDYTFGKTVDNILDEKAVNRNGADIDVGQAFLCAISTTGRKFTSSGEVPQATTYIETEAAHPFFLSYLPTSKKLSQITVESVEADSPFDPDTEYIQVLDKGDTHVTRRYTYLSAQYCDWYADEVDEDLADILRENIGWWDYTFGKTVDNILDEKAVNRDNEDVNPADSFLCAISTTGRKINFPGALD